MSDLGYDPGIIDGVFGANTRAAIEKCYTDQGKLFDGVLDQNEFSDLISPRSDTPETSTDLGFRSACRAIESGQASALWKGIRALPLVSVQNYSNIGFDQIVDLFGDGVLDATSVQVSGSFPRLHTRNIKFFSPNPRQMNDRFNGIAFLNEQPTSKEIRKVLQGDLNADNIIDMAFIDYGEHDGPLHDGKVILLLSEGTSYRWHVIKSPPQLRIHTGAFIDIDNDNDLDLIIGAASPKSGVGIFAFKNNGQGHFTQSSSPRSGALHEVWVSLDASDIDQDGYQDLIAERVERNGKRGVQILWGSKWGVLRSVRTTQLASPDLGPDDLLMSAIVYRVGARSHILASLAAENYQGGTKIIVFEMAARQQTGAKLVLEGLGKTSTSINTFYPCRSGLKFFTYHSPDFNARNHIR